MSRMTLTEFHKIAYQKLTTIEQVWDIIHAKAHAAGLVENFVQIAVGSERFALEIARELKYCGFESSLYGKGKETVVRISFKNK